MPPPERDKPAVFLYVGRLKFEGQKRVKDLFDGLTRTTGEWQLHIIGDGSDFEKCQAYSRELGIEQRVIWYGWQSAPWQVVQQKIKMSPRYYLPLRLRISYDPAGSNVIWNSVY
ncbi:Lipopolysaccharide 16-galactosyl transferase [Salmonella enterica subsp. enterica]|uniref:Lipopolysaccharide 16-galactosyl transferase n=1 Tax=Salmonella enterica I TaxID=59201 RepID=A0A379WIT8_SALET|nr:Lipopolysaccharide 16-galactosyl transferase [Salmonella enterica subsp. enterica]